MHSALLSQVQASLLQTKASLTDQEFSLGQREVNGFQRCNVPMCPVRYAMAPVVV